jgi:hypothetical protein
VSTAHHLNVTASAIPGSWKKEPRGEDVVSTSFASCLSKTRKLRRPVASGTSSNYLYPSSGRVIASQVQVYKSAGDASAAASKARGGAFARCLTSTVRAKLAATFNGQEKVQHIRVRAGGVPGMKAGESSQRVDTVITYSLPGGKTGGTTDFTDVVAFAHQTALVEVEFDSDGSVPPKSLETAVLASLQRRAASVG